MRGVMAITITETALPLPLARRGKVRDIYDLGDSFLFVATDRISAFDVVLSPGIPDKGRILNQISVFWFGHFAGIENHLLETEFDQFPLEVRAHPELRGRSVIVRKCSVIPIECVARGYLIGSGWKEYQQSGTVCGSNPPSFDKQFVRDWLESTGWDKNPPAPELPPEVVANTREKYIAAYRQLTGNEL